MRILFFAIFWINSLSAFSQKQEKIVRIAEIVIDTNYVQAYKNLLQEEARASVLLEPGVEAIMPMFNINDPSKITILEIYKNQISYENHLKTPHFLKYKSETLKMIKSLKLTDMIALDPESLSTIFQKIKP